MVARVDAPVRVDAVPRVDTREPPGRAPAAVAFGWRSVVSQS
jgi:hypothetical protein